MTNIITLELKVDPTLINALTTLAAAVSSGAQAPIAASTPAPAAITAPVPIAPIPPAVPTAAATYTLEQLASAAAPLVANGKREELVALLASFGVDSMSKLPQEQYGAFATQLRAKGAKI